MKIIKKYVLKSYLSPYLKGLAALMLIMTITHFFDFLHVFLDNRPAATRVAYYFFKRLPEWFVMIMPVATLLAVLFSLGALNRHHELTAIKSSGIRLRYVFIPIVVFSLCMSVLSGILSETVVPGSTAKAEELFQQIREREPQQIEIERKNFRYLGEGRRLYSIDLFLEKKAEGFTLIEFSPGTSREKSLVYAQKAVYRGGNLWMLSNGAIREFSSEGDVVSYNEFENHMLILPEIPENFAKPLLHPEQMDILTLASHIGKLERGGFQTRSERVILHNKIAFPFSNTIILILGIPLALWSGTQNRTTGFFISIIICFLYWGAISVGKAMGTQGVIPPALGAWSANIVFLALSLGMLKASRIT